MKHLFQTLITILILTAFVAHTWRDQGPGGFLLGM